MQVVALGNANYGIGVAEYVQAGTSWLATMTLPRPNATELGSGGTSRWGHPPTGPTWPARWLSDPVTAVVA